MDIFKDYLEEKLRYMEECIAQIRGFISSIDVEGTDEEITELKLSYGQGSIRHKTTERGRGYWEARIQIDGVVKSFTNKRQLECVNRLREYRNSVRRERRRAVALPKSELFGEWLNFWYQNYKKMNIGKSTRESYEICINKHVTEELKNKPLVSLKTMDIMQAIASIEVVRQRKITSQLIIACLKQAYAEGKIKTILWHGIVVKDKKAAIKNIISDEEFELLISRAGEYGKYFLAYRYTGCRPSEIFELTVNPEARLLTINGTKTEKSVRTVPLFNPLVGIIPLPKVSLRKLQNFLSEYNKEYNTRITVYSLRHKFATDCYERGISIKTVQVWMGHSSIQLTGDTYTHHSTLAEAREYVSVFDKK